MLRNGVNAMNAEHYESDGEDSTGKPIHRKGADEELRGLHITPVSRKSGSPLP